MRDAVKASHEQSHKSAVSQDRPDFVTYKSGSPEDRNRQGAR